MTDDEKKLLHFISNTPCGEDMFEGKSQEHIAETIQRDIKDGKNKIIGIDGGWGSGKSNVIKIIEKSTLKESCLFFNYDVWGHQEDLQRKNILWELIEFFEKGQNREILKNLPTITDDVKKITGKTVEKTTRQIPRLSFAVIMLFFLLIVMPFVESFFKLSSDNTLKYIMLLLFGVAFCCCLLVALIIAWIDTKEENGTTHFWACLSQLILFYKGKSITTKNVEFEHETNPSISSFVALICKISNGIKGKKLILVFDNMDRLQPDKVKEFWSSLHTLFADRIPLICEDIFVIVPFDREHLRVAFSSYSINYGDDYINKTFNVVYRISPPILSDWKKFFRLKWQESQLKYSEEEFNRVLQAYDLLSKEVTPRNIIAFINEFVAVEKQLQENIPAQYIAIFILKKNEILYDEAPRERMKPLRQRDPQEAILNKKFLGALNLIYQYDNNLSKYIAALLYQIPSKMAIEVVYSKQIKDALENADTKTICEIQKQLPCFNDLLDAVMIDLVNPENAAIALGSLPPKSLGSKRQDKWDELYVLCKEAQLTIDQTTLLKSHKLLIQNISEKDSFISIILQNIVKQEDTQLNIVGYYDVLHEINNIVANHDITRLTPKRNIPPEMFLTLLSHSKENCIWTGITTDSKQMDDYLQKLQLNDLSGIEAIRYADSSFCHKLENFCKKMQTLSRNNAGNRAVLPLIITLLTVVSPDKVNHGLNDAQVMNQFRGREKSEQGYYDFLCMRIASGQNFRNDCSEAFNEALQDKDPKHINAICGLISKHLDFGEMLLNFSMMKQYPTYVEVIKSLILNVHEGQVANIKVILPHFAEIINELAIDAEVLWNKLSSFPRPITESDVPETLPFSTLQTAVMSDSGLGKYCVKLTVNYLTGFSTDRWREQLSTTNSYGIKELLAIKLPWTISLTEGIKNTLCDIAKGETAIPIREPWEKLINYAIESGNSVSSIFNSVKDSILAGTGISVDQFIFFGPWLFEYAILDDKQDICRKFFPISILDNDKAILIVLKYKEKIPSIFSIAGADKDTFTKAIQEKITQDKNSPLWPLAKELHIGSHIPKKIDNTKDKK